MNIETDFTAKEEISRPNFICFADLCQVLADVFIAIWQKNYAQNSTLQKKRRTHIRDNRDEVFIKYAAETGSNKAYEGRDLA